MAVYVDGVFEWTPSGKQAARHGSKWCHLAADSTRELVAFAARLGLPEKYLQMGGGGRFPHFDLTPTKRKQAVAWGAQEVTAKELLAILKSKAP